MKENKLEKDELKKIAKMSNHELVIYYGHQREFNDWRANISLNEILQRMK